MKEYKYDIAISLCQQDVAFARELVKALNPKIEVFFYEDRQAELISKSGPEEFARTFREDCRMVVILHREAWSKSRYTKLEHDAIVERTGEEGMEFIYLIPLEERKKPSWYPASRIYASPFNSSVEELAKYIEIILTQRGAEISPLTFEEKIKHLDQGLKKRQEHLNYLRSPETGELVKDELKSFMKQFNLKCKPEDSDLHFLRGMGHHPFHLVTVDSPLDRKAHLTYDKYALLAKTSWNQHQRKANSQSATLTLSVLVKSNMDGQERFDPLHEEKYKFNTDRNELHGWSEMLFQPKDLANDKSQFFLHTHEPGDLNYYDLGGILTTEELLAKWFVLFLEKVEKPYKKLLM